jgi:hypothetical protein
MPLDPPSFTDPTEAFGMATLAVQVLWEGYASAVLPGDCSDVQRRETKRAFFGGAWSMFQLVNELGTPRHSELAGVITLNAVQMELEAYFARIREGKE